MTPIRALDAPGREAVAGGAVGTPSANSATKVQTMLVSAGAINGTSSRLARVIANVLASLVTQLAADHRLRSRLRNACSHRPT
jgi:hypothetical protein